MKPDESGVVACRYGCRDCDDFGGDSRNGVGIAAQHAENYDHEVWCEQVTSMVWNNGDSE
jgi:hypothetical protein